MLTFDAFPHLPKGGGPPLPENFVPAALPALQTVEAVLAEACAKTPEGVEDEALVAALERKLSLILTGPDEVLIEPVALETIADPAKLVAMLSEFRGGGPAPSIEFGPPADRRRRLAVSEGRTRAPCLDDGAFEEHGTLLGIVDAGIAFWNPIFWQDAPGAFEDAGALVLDGPGRAAVQWLDCDEVRAAGPDAAPAGRDAAARATMMDAFPGSAFGAYRGHEALLSPGALAHGTAMAALALEGQRRAGHGRPVPMIGLELPRTVLFDATGSMLAATLDLAVRGLIERAVAIGARRLVVLAAFAFTGGPQDAAPAVLRRLRRTARRYEGLIEVEVVMPVGNHLHDRLHARIDEAPCYGGPQLAWKVMRDDHSVNAIDVVLPNAGHRTIELQPPGALPEAAAVHEFALDTVYLIREEGRIVGALHARRIAEERGADPGEDPRVRVCIALAPTAQAAHLRPRLPRAEAGTWRVGFPGHEALEAWVLRDDAPFDDARLRPRRQSWFADPLYQTHGAIGVPAIADPAAPRGPVRRHGARSPLFGAPIDDATALWARIAGGDPAPAIYAGLGMAGEPGTAAQIVDRPGPNAGMGTIANGTARRFRVSGTSAAAALEAGGRAARRRP